MAEIPYGSESFRKLNPHLFPVGAVARAKSEQNAARALDRSGKARKTSPCRLVISLVRQSRRKLDSDNLAGSFKPLRDAIAATLRVDDADPRLEWNYEQLTTRGRPGTIVLIERKTL